MTPRVVVFLQNAVAPTLAQALSWVHGLPSAAVATHWPAMLHAWPCGHGAQALPWVPQTPLLCAAWGTQLVPFMLQQPCKQLLALQVGAWHAPLLHVLLPWQAMHAVPPPPHLLLFCCGELKQVSPSQQPLQLPGPHVCAGWQVPVAVLHMPLAPVHGPQVSPAWPHTKLLCESSVTQSPLGAQQPLAQELALQLGLPPPWPPPVEMPPPLPPPMPVMPPPLPPSPPPPPWPVSATQTRPSQCVPPAQPWQLAPRMPHAVLESPVSQTPRMLQQPPQLAGCNVHRGCTKGRTQRSNPE